MSITDFIVPTLTFILVIKNLYFSPEKWYNAKNLLEILVGICIMTFSIWAAIQSSDSTSNLEKNLNKLVSSQTIDSLNNAKFQKYLKDSLGLDKRGNSVVLVNRSIYNSFEQSQKYPPEKEPSLSQTVEYATMNDFAINRAAEIMKDGKQEGAIKLRSFWKNSNNTVDSRRAKVIYQDICNYYDSIAVNYIKENPFMIFGQDGYLPLDKNEREGFERAIKEMNDTSTSLERLAILIHGFSISAKITPHCFETAKINSWFQSLKKQ